MKKISEYLKWNKNYALVFCLVLSGLVMMISFGVLFQ